MPLRLLAAIRRSTVGAVHFCDSCAQVCTDRCRAVRHRERQLESALRHGPHR